jgi:RHS repeat-associated protein
LPAVEPKTRVRSFCSGEQYDSDLSLYYLRARYYNPNTGRFMSRDPERGNRKDPASLHKYLYANGDPINGFDPTGKSVFIDRQMIKTFLHLPAVFALRLAAAVICSELELVDRAILEPLGDGIPWPAMLPCDLYAVAEGVLLATEMVAAEE